ncbi:tetratricopeptide repeat protein [Roseivirga sp.]|uniref:tetratricopeptide repeat protein n=1 Tax=Roseivirga sp. TaxID=1964215 RepID=UPI002B270148|nr:tetratricopeptide repeat protein [Roseivirga sp.]
MNKYLRFYPFIFTLLLFCSSTEAIAQEKKGKESKEVSKYERANAEYLMIDAQKFYLLEDYERAIAFLEQSLEIDKDNHAAYFKLGEIFLIQRKYDNGLKSIKKAQEIKPDNKFYYILAAQLHKSQSNLQAAASEYELMLKNATDYREYLLDLADVYVGLGNYDGAIKMLELTEEKYNTPNKFTTQKKELLLQAGKKKEALNMLKKLTEDFPGNESYKLEYADLLASTGNKTEAADILNSTKISTSSNFLLINLKLEEGDFEAAKPMISEIMMDKEADLSSKLLLMSNLSATGSDKISLSFLDQQQKTLYSIYPNDVEVIKTGEKVYSALAEKANSQDKAAYETQAFTALNQLKDLNPSDYEVWNQLLTKAYNQNSWDVLLINSEDALSYFPNQGLFYYYYGSAQLYSSKGDKEEANMAFDQALKLARNDESLTNKIRSKKLEFALEEENIKENRTTFQIPVASGKADREAINLMLRYLNESKEQKVIEDVLVLADDLIKEYPLDGDLFHVKAKVLFQLGRFAEAKQLIENFIKQNPANITGGLLEVYGDNLFMLNQIDAAVEQWKKAKNTGNTSDKIDKKIADKKYY